MPATRAAAGLTSGALLLLLLCALAGLPLLALPALPAPLLRCCSDATSRTA